LVRHRLVSRGVTTTGEPKRVGPSEFERKGALGRRTGCAARQDLPHHLVGDVTPTAEPGRIGNEFFLRRPRRSVEDQSLKLRDEVGDVLRLEVDRGLPARLGQ
jgi:hypothetical protein